MMSEADLIRMVKQLVRAELAPILMGTVVSNTSQSRVQGQRFTTESPIPNMRSIQPYGVSSRAPAGTQGLVIPVNADATHLLLAGHFDESKPTGADGETFLYNEFGQMVYLSNGKIQVGTKASASPLVLGDIFKTFMTSFLEQYIAHTHVGNLGYETSPPITASDTTELLTSPIEDSAILSDLAFTEKGGS